MVRADTQSLQTNQMQILPRFRYVIYSSRVYIFIYSVFKMLSICPQSFILSLGVIILTWEDEIFVSLKISTIEINLFLKGFEAVPNEVEYSKLGRFLVLYIC